MNDEWVNKTFSGYGEYKLHHQKTCYFDNVDIGKNKKAAAKKRRSDFYKTEEGQAKEKDITLKKLLRRIS